MSEKYVPNYGDLERFRYERLIRTKSRAYQIACWQGYLGTHEPLLHHVGHKPVEGQNSHRSSAARHGLAGLSRPLP